MASEGQLAAVSTAIDVLKAAANASTAPYPHMVPERQTVRRMAHQLADLCKQDECIDEIVRLGAIETVVPLFCGSGSTADTAAMERLDSQTQQIQEELEKECCFILGLLAVKPDYQARIAHSGALAGLVRLLRNYRQQTSLPPTSRSQTGSGGVVRRAADALTNLAHENVDIKHRVREEGGIPPLVILLDVLDVKVQRAACGALRTLAFKNEENKSQIVEQNAVPMLIQLLRSEDPGVHYEAVGVIGNLVHSSVHVKKRVLEEGALQPVINLLSSECPDSQREAALLLGQFATVDTADTKIKIVQRGAVPALVRMLESKDDSLKEMAAFALGRLVQNADNQAGAVQCGALPPLLALLESKHYNLQHNAAFALYGLAENEDNVPDMIREGALQRLEECLDRLQVQASKDCVQKTITRMEQKLTGASSANKRALSAVIFLLRASNPVVQQRAAMSLARLAPEDQLKTIFIDKAGVDVLLEVLTDPKVSMHVHREAANALLQLTKKLDNTLPVDQAPQQPGRSERSVYLGEEYVNNHMLSDITFMVEGRQFHAHRIALLASSEAFRAMFNGGYREKDANSIEIPNISYEVFEAMMRFVYTGQVNVRPEIAFELLQASDQYLLEGLKRLCEHAIAQSLDVTTVLPIYDHSESYSAPQLAKRCILFALEHYEDVLMPGGMGACSDPSMLPAHIMQRMAPTLRLALYTQASAERQGAVPMQGVQMQTAVASPTASRPATSMSVERPATAMPNAP